MPPRTDTSLTALLLAQRLVETPAQPLKASEYWAVLRRVPDPAELLGLDPAAISERIGGLPELGARIAQLLDAAPAVAFRLEELVQSGITVVTTTDDGYPRRLVERLGASAPPLLYTVGDVSLLTGNLLGIVGSRNVSETGAEAARRAARQAAAHKVGVVSGGAKGVDRVAMFTALEAGAMVVGVLADSLQRVTREPEIRRRVTTGHLCLCTPYKPTAGFSVANAMGRNKVIYGLSRATLVIAAEANRGGTWAGAVEALRRHSAPVLAWTGDTSGHGDHELVKLGAQPVDQIDTLFPLPIGRVAPGSGSQQMAFPV